MGCGGLSDLSLTAQKQDSCLPLYFSFSTVTCHLPPEFCSSNSSWFPIPTEKFPGLVPTFSSPRPGQPKLWAPGFPHILQHPQKSLRSTLAQPPAAAKPSPEGGEPGK